ncbi:ribonuclease VapC [Amylibacter ulvae]|uniref:Ribonuclease VapC n=1 Tax=Paramylibacter ulvae TaxID=1651968 RepID=A0ABQ3DC17_9RHOB|nr:PIN domain-containing protein [Amylibacter ulvae]GHA61586.1 ribonuclease VapC [Amylibacter ulvae]
MSDRFIDTSVILYLLEDSDKADVAEAVLSGGGVVSVQVLNEALANCRRKANMNWDEASIFLNGIQDLCDVCDLTEDTHVLGRALGAKYGFSVYDAMIVAAALTNGCTELLSEDMQHGQIIEGGLKILNPFRDKM